MQLPDQQILQRSNYIEMRFPHPDSPTLFLSLKGAGNMSWKSSEGVSNRQRLYSLLEIDAPVHGHIQEHTREVHTPDQRTSTSPPARIGDGLVQTERREWLSATAADCMPIWIWNPLSGRTALLHSGWKGTGILLDGLEAMQALDGPTYCAEEVRVLLGPSIGSCCYRVDRARYAQFSSLWGEKSVRYQNGEYYLSLLDANRRLAAEAGVGYCYHYSPCTRCNPEFGSFRREGPENFTSMLALSGYFQ